MADGPARDVRLSAGLARDLRDHLEACEAALAGGSGARWCRDLRGSLETLLLQQDGVILSLDVPLAPPPGTGSGGPPPQNVRGRSAPSAGNPPRCGRGSP